MRVCGAGNDTVTKAVYHQGWAALHVAALNGATKARLLPAVHANFDSSGSNHRIPNALHVLGAWVALICASACARHSSRWVNLVGSISPNSIRARVLHIVGTIACVPTRFPVLCLQQEALWGGGATERESYVFCR